MSRKQIVTTVIVITIILYLVWTYHRGIHLFAGRKKTDDQAKLQKVVTVTEAKVYSGTLDMDIDGITIDQKPLIYPAEYVLGEYVGEKSGFIQVKISHTGEMQIVPKSKVKIIGG